MPQPAQATELRTTAAHRSVPSTVHRRAVGFLAVACAAIMATSACVISAASVEPLPFQAERTLQGAIAVPAGVRVEVENLAGAMRIESATGDRVELEAVVRAGGATDADAAALAEKIQLEMTLDGDRVLVRVTYPVQDYSRFHYSLGREGGILQMFGGSSTEVRYMDRRVGVSSSRARGAASVHADVLLKLPAGVDTRILNVVGEVRIGDLAADLAVDLHAGAIASSGTRGRFVLDTGSGSVEVSDHRGELTVDTGSGAVKLAGVRGETRVDTGSGSVELEDVEAPFVSVDTGSGTVTLRDVSGSLEVDTGSGAIRGTGLVTGDSVRADTGSGTIRLEGDFSAAKAIEIDTSSGAVDLVLAAWGALDLDLNTGSGSVEIDLPDVTYEVQRRDRVVGRLGDGNGGRLLVDTGSGSIVIRAR